MRDWAETEEPRCPDCREYSCVCPEPDEVPVASAEERRLRREEHREPQPWAEDMDLEDVPF